MLLAREGRFLEVRLGHAQDPQAFVGHREDGPGQLLGLGAIEMAQIGNGLRGALGGDDVVLPRREICQTCDRASRFWDRGYSRTSVQSS